MPKGFSDIERESEAVGETSRQPGEHPLSAESLGSGAASKAAEAAKTREAKQASSKAKAQRALDAALGIRRK